MAITLRDFGANDQPIQAYVMPGAQQRSGLSSNPIMQASMFNQDGLYDQRTKAYFMDPFNAPQEAPSTFAAPGTNTSVLDGDKYIADQIVGGKHYNPYTKLYGSKATRNYNPGNISGMGGNLLYGAQRIARSKHGDAGDRGQLVFQNARDGWRGMYSLMSGDSYNNAPIRKAFAKYQTDQVAYANMLKDLSSQGINVDTKFNSLPMKQKIAFMQSRANHEGFKGERLHAGILS